MTEDGGVTIVSECRLQRVHRPWVFARDNATAIDRHWQARLLTHPSHFNGVIYLLAQEATVQEGTQSVFTASFYKTDFKSFLYWREHGYPVALASDSFGSAIVRSAEGHILLGRQNAGNINSGLAYLPGGFIDERDVSADGTIDIGSSIVRELAEETGLTRADLSIEPGFRIIRCGPLIAMAREVRSALPAVALRAAILDYLARDQSPELGDIVIITKLADLEGANVPPYTAMAVRHVFETRGGNA
jgi:8-oxo-dGTP pyrophosphatase MutT (NUDIX family)